MELLRLIFIEPFETMYALPDLLLQTIWEGLVSGTLYSLIALGFVLIFKASGVFNFAQGIMVVFAALVLVGIHALGVPAYVSLILTLGVMALLAIVVVRLVMKPYGQPARHHILFMSTIGITFILIAGGQLIVWR